MCVCVCVCACACVCARPLSSIWLFATPWTVPCQAPLSTGFLSQEYWSRLLFSTPGDLPDPGIEPMSLRLLHWPVDSLPLHRLGSPFCTRGDSKYLRLYGLHGLCCNNSTAVVGWKWPQTICKRMGVATFKQIFMMLKCEFYIMFTYHEMFLFFFFSPN